MGRRSRNIGRVLIAPEMAARSVYPSPTYAPTWEPSSISGCLIAPAGRLTKTAADATWGNAGAVSTQSFPGDCFLSYFWRAPFNTGAFIGLSTDTSCNNYNTVDYGLNLETPGTNDRQVGKYQNGSVVGTSTIIATSTTDMFVRIDIERVGTQVTAWYLDSRNAAIRNKILDFSNSSSGDLYINAAFYLLGSSLDVQDMIWSGGSPFPGPILELQADTLGLADNDPVTTWTDLSGYRNDCAQATGTKKPTYKATNGPGGRPCVNFDAGDLLNATSAIGTALTPKYTIFAVIRPADNSPRTIISAGITGGIQYRTNSKKPELLNASVASIGTATTACSSVTFQQINVTWDSTTATFRLSGAADGSGTNAQTITKALDTIGAQGGGGEGEKFSGDICMIKVYNRVLSAAEIAVEEAAITARWGV